MKKTSNCEECDAAFKNPQHAGYSAQCSECSARALAHSEEAKDGHARQCLTDELRRALIATFGESWRAGLLRVKYWVCAIKEAKNG